MCFKIYLVCYQPRNTIFLVSSHTLKVLIPFTYQSAFMFVFYRCDFCKWHLVEILRIFTLLLFVPRHLFLPCLMYAFIDAFVLLLLGVGVVAQWVKLPLATPASCTRAQVWVQAALIQLLTNAPGKAMEDNVSAWASAATRASLGGARGSWLWPGPYLTIVVISGHEPVAGGSLSFSLSQYFCLFSFSYFILHDLFCVSLLFLNCIFLVSLSEFYHTVFPLGVCVCISLKN